MDATALEAADSLISNETELDPFAFDVDEAAENEASTDSSDEITVVPRAAMAGEHAEAVEASDSLSLSGDIPIFEEFDVAKNERIPKAVYNNSIDIIGDEFALTPRENSCRAKDYHECCYGFGPSRIFCEPPQSEGLEPPPKTREQHEQMCKKRGRKQAVCCASIFGFVRKCSCYFSPPCSSSIQSPFDNLLYPSLNNY